MKKIDSYLNYLQEIEPVTMAMMGLSAASLLISATRTFKQYFTKAARQCGDLSETEKSLCLLRAKMMAKKVELASLKDAMNKCRKAKNPESCQSKIKNKYTKVANEIKFFQSRMNATKSKK